MVIAGYQKKSRVLSDQEKKIVAYHETGHALVAALQTHSAPVQKITIIPRTSGALGYTLQVDDGDHFLMSKEELLNKIATYTGGRAAEELVFHSITTGASNDIEQATKLARAMISRFGMSDEFGFVAFETVSNQYLGGRRLPGLLPGDPGPHGPEGDGDGGQPSTRRPWTMLKEQRGQAPPAGPVPLRARDHHRAGVHGDPRGTAGGLTDGLLLPSRVRKFFLTNRASGPIIQLQKTGEPAAAG